MGRGKTFRSQLQAYAVEQHGFVTPADVRRLGVPERQLEKLLARGRLQCIDDDLYQLDGMPRCRRSQYAEAVLRVGRGAFLSHDAVLALHDLTEHEPDQVRVATPRPPGTRRWPARLSVLHRDVPAEDLTTYRGIRSTTVARALVDCRGLLPVRTLTEAADEAARRSLLLRRERHEVLAALEPTRT